MAWFAAALGPDGWLVSGLTSQPWPAELPAAEARFEGALLSGPLRSAFGPADALGRHPFLAFLQAPRPPCGALLELSLQERRIGWPPGLAAVPALEPAAAGRAGRLLLAGAANHEALRAVLPGPVFTETDSLAALGLPIRLLFDAVIGVPPRGIALAGTLSDPLRLVARLALKGDDWSVPLDRDLWAEIPRADPAAGEATPQTGFIAHAVVPGDPDCVEIETREGEIGHVPLPPPQQGATLAVIQQFLAVPRQRLSRMARVMEGSIGPITRGLNRARLATRPTPRRLEYGISAAAPARSLIIPLHGRLDYMAMQLALFAARPDPGAEIIYVLDDPSLWSEAERLAQSCLVRFGLAFSMLDLGEHLGYAPANNAGLAAARGAHLCLLNADVFPLGDEGMGWLPRLCQPLDDPGVGAVGARLLFEDGTIQHDGMEYARIPSLPPWPFPVHPGKGTQPEPAPPGGRVVTALTGACLAARRADLLAVGGLDEDCIIADFEDAALCEALSARGLRLELRSDVVLYHLERQTPGSDAPWRFGATMVNASHFAARWNPDATG